MRDYRRLSAAEIVVTLQVLRKRIDERFPGSGLSKVAAEVHDVACENVDRVRSIRRSSPFLRTVIFLLLAGTLGLGGYVGASLLSGNIRWAPETGSDLIQEIESGLGIVVFVGAAVVYLWSVDARLKRVRALTAIHELRSLAHIVDMHQLTKDPERVLGRGSRTASSPRMTMTPFLLGRYLDYCSELLALIATVGALYAESFDDPLAVAAVDEIEDLTTGLSRKIWQKIMILDRVAPDAGDG